MGVFGSFKVNEDIGNIVYGMVELGPIAAGTYEPKSLEEFEALAHVASTSVQPEGAEKSVVLVELVTEPDVVVPTAAAESTSAPVLPEPPPASAPPAPTAPTAPAAPTSSAPDVPPAAPPAGKAS